MVISEKLPTEIEEALIEIVSRMNVEQAQRQYAWCNTLPLREPTYPMGTEVHINERTSRIEDEKAARV